jgi:ethanolamine ammonia-lyase small subunit
MSDWETLRRFTQARIGIGRTGHGIPTTEHLKFQLDHARARDAVHWTWDIDGLQKKLKSDKIQSFVVKTPALSRTEYLARPDLGRKLDPASEKELRSIFKKPYDIAFLLSNGLSSSAIETHGLNFLKVLMKELRQSDFGLPSHFKLSPVFIADNSRVALSDSVGAAVKAKMVVMLVGERPGLTSSDSLAMYLTYAPKIGNTDAKRNCISNIRPPEGLDYKTAAKKTLFLITESFRRKLSGVQLKDETELLE